MTHKQSNVFSLVYGMQSMSRCGRMTVIVFYIVNTATDLFKTNNEWFWPHDDPTVYGQLCWSNASLVQFVLGRVLIDVLYLGG